MLWSSLASICFQLPLCWAFIFKLNLGNAGAAMSIGISFWFNVILLVIYVKYSSTCKKTLGSFSKDVFMTMREFFQFAIPSAVMVCLEWWSFELVILLSGLLPNPQLETSVLSLCLTITSLHYHVPYSFGAATSTLVSNELGAGKPEAARIALFAVMVLAVADFLIASIVVFMCRCVLGYAFSEEKEVVGYIQEMAPFLCISIIMDSLQSVLSGVARGSGWQHIGAYVNLGAYYLVGVPVALLLGFVWHLKGEGLWSGLLAGATVQSFSLSLITALTNWEKQFGMASALETLCGQAHGAEQYQKLGTYTYAAIISLLIVCIPISILWIFIDKLLILMGQDISISVEAGRYATWLIPSLFPYAILQALNRYLQTQSLILPMVFTSVTALLVHIPICWALVFNMEIGIAGAALSIVLSNWFNVIFLVLYIKYSTACKKTLAPFSCKDLLPSMREFFSFAVPSAVMVCLEWWSCEIVILLSGLLPNPQIETSVLSICLLIASLHYFLPYSIGAAASTRVSNELGADRPDRARASVWAANVLSIAEGTISCTILLCCRRFLGYAFSNEKEVVDYLAEITPFVCLMLAMDCIQAVLGGVARGSGWQHLGAYVNLGAYYLVGLPIAIVLGFVLRLNGKGLWIGLNMGAIVQATLLSLVTCSTNWRKQASLARQRIFDETKAADGKS